MVYGNLILYEGFANDVLSAGGAPYSLLPSSFRCRNSFTDKSCFFADILLDLLI